MITVHASAGASALPDAARACIEDVCAHTEADLRTYLPSLPENIDLVCAIRSREIPGLGYTASAQNRHTIAFTLNDADASTLECIVREHLRHTLFHECHHLARGWVKQGGERHPSFMHGVVCEGLASVFERDAGDYAPPWSVYPDAVREWVDELLALPARADYRQWMFRHPDGRVWIGYKAGVYVAERAIARCGRDAAQLVDVPCHRILELAGLPPSRFGLQP